MGLTPHQICIWDGHAARGGGRGSHGNQLSTRLATNPTFANRATPWAMDNDVEEDRLGYTDVKSRLTRLGESLRAAQYLAHTYPNSKIYINDFGQAAL